MTTRLSTQVASPRHPIRLLTAWGSLALACVVLAACAVPAHRVTTEPGPPDPVTPAATGGGSTSAPTRQPTPAPSPSPTPAGPRPRTAYRLDLKLDYSSHSASIHEEISYTSPADQDLSELDLVVETNHYAGAFHLTSAAVDGQAVASPSLAEHRLVLPLSQPLRPGQSASISLDYTLSLPAIPPATGDRRPQVFGYSERQTNLVDWYPYVAVYRSGTGWLIHDAWVFGEHQVYEASDYQVTLALVNPIPGLVVAASAAAGAPGSGATYRLEAARTFALSISPAYVTTTQVAGDVTITSYAFAWDKASGEKAAQDTAQAVALYSRLFGPYPHPALSVVEAAFLDGMEYDGLYFLSYGFYNLYETSDSDAAKTWLTAIAVHETAHQWWFALVGDDQAEEPWLDESFATFCELLYGEQNDPGLVDWWQTVRIQENQPAGLINLPVDKYGSFALYRNAVYLRGAEFLVDLRKLMGDEAFSAFLKDLAARFADQQLTAKDFFAVLKEHTSADIQPLLDEYFDPSY